MKHATLPRDPLFRATKWENEPKQREIEIKIEIKKIYVCMCVCGKKERERGGREEKGEKKNANPPNRIMALLLWRRDKNP